LAGDVWKKLHFCINFRKIIDFRGESLHFCRNSQRAVSSTKIQIADGEFGAF
jgi:hypothetical protein